jgi:hypothetical protein
MSSLKNKGQPYRCQVVVQANFRLKSQAQACSHPWRMCGCVGRGGRVMSKVAVQGGQFVVSSILEFGARGEMSLMVG